MKQIFAFRNIAALVAMVTLLGVSGASAQKRRPVLKKKPVVRKIVRDPLYTVPANTVVRVRMNSTISSKTARVGDTFTTTVTEPVYSSTGVVVIPVGATVMGRVDSVTPAGNKGKPGSIDAHFTSVRLPNGKTRAINGSLTDLSSGKTSSDNEGSATAKGMSHRKVIFIGGGAAGGALLGGAFGGGKGALIGGLLGAGGGFLGDRYTKGPNAEVKSGTEFGVWLNQSISMPRFAEAGPVNP